MAFELPVLPYDYKALEPHIDERTMRIHHGMHHQAYTNNLNGAIAGVAGQDGVTIEGLLRDLDAVPEGIRMAVRNNGGGYANHNLFWTVMSPAGGGAPEGVLAEAINSAFGSVDAFKGQFSKAAGTRFGSGWAWLALDGNGTLQVYSTANQDSPYMKGHTPLLGLDVWEHAYYLNYQNRRPDYVAAFWNVVNWNQVAANFIAARG